MNARLIGVVSESVAGTRLAALGAVHEFGGRESLKLILDKARPLAPFIGRFWF